MKIKNIAKMIVYYAILRHCAVIPSAAFVPRVN
jgi:hypothetical protein